MHYVYILRDKKGVPYIGYTNNLQRRFLEHQKEDKNIWTLIYYEAYILEKLAREREKKLKYYGSAWRALKKRLTA